MMQTTAVTIYEHYMSTLLVKLYARHLDSATPPENIKDTGEDKLGEIYGRQSHLKQPETLLAGSLVHFTRYALP